MDAFLKLILAAVLEVIDEPEVQRLIARPIGRKLAEFIPGDVADDKVGAFLVVIGQELIAASEEAPPV